MTSPRGAIVHVITRLTLGGSSESTIAAAQALQRAGWEPTLAVGLGESETATIDEARRRGCRVVDIPTLGREVAPVRDLRALADLIALLRRTRAVAVHTHTSKAGFVGRLAARIAGTPIVVHQPHGHIFYGYWGAPRTRLFVTLERLAARWTDRIITLTERGTDEHLAQGIGRREQYVAIPSGVPTAALRALAPTRVTARARLGLGRNAFVVIAVGRFVPVKGFDLAVAALPHLRARVPDARLVLLGDGPERTALEAQACALGVADMLRVPGVVAPASAPLATWLAAADVFAAPSRNEGMGRALVEAMAVGVPVVGAAVGGIPDVIGDDEAGLLVPPGDPVALAAALGDLAIDVPLREKLGLAAVARAERFSSSVSDARVVALYDALAAAKGLA